MDVAGCVWVRVRGGRTRGGTERLASQDEGLEPLGRAHHVFVAAALEAAREQVVGQRLVPFGRGPRLPRCLQTTESAPHSHSNAGDPGDHGRAQARRWRRRARNANGPAWVLSARVGRTIMGARSTAETGAHLLWQPSNVHQLLLLVLQHLGHLRHW